MMIRALSAGATAGHTHMVSYLFVTLKDLNESHPFKEKKTVLFEIFILNITTKQIKMSLKSLHKGKKKEENSRPVSQKQNNWARGVGPFVGAFRGPHC